MKDFFLQILELSLAASWLVPLVLLLRLVLKKAPRFLVCVLWGMVALRLLMPLSVESPVSMHPGREPFEKVETEFFLQENTPADPIPDLPTVPQETPALPTVPQETPTTPQTAVPQEKSVDPVSILAWVWLAGVCAMALYGGISYLRLRLKVRASLQIEKRVYLCDNIGYPFLLGVIRPRIYLPSGMEDGYREYVSAHEKAHLRRGDHLWKPFGFVLLAVHWFNPLLWAAYFFLCGDIETACDEKVIRAMDNSHKAEYSRALVACSMQGTFHRGWISACPVAFGESGVKSRVKGVLSYKKPAFWVLLIAVLACVAVGVFFLTDPPTEQTTIVSTSKTESSQEDFNKENAFHVLIGSGYLFSTKYSISDQIEVQDETESHKNPNLEGSQMPFYHFGSEETAPEYKFTFRNAFTKEEIDSYSAHKQTYLLDSRTNELRGFYFSEFPQGYDVRTTSTNAFRAKKICHAFLQEYLPEINLNQWVLEIEFDYADYNHYRFIYYKYSNGIKTGSLNFELDECGNLYFFSYTCNESDTLPQYNDDAYISAAKKRIESFYADKKDVLEIKDYVLDTKTNVYINSLNCAAIDYTVWYTVVYSDGTEEQTGNVFYLPYDETGTAIVVDVEETVDK